jgi:murein DD-endopeptidase MepM/ murein hydrolase activator NlpD
MSAYSDNSGFLSGKGFYVALALCLAGAGAAAYFAANTTDVAAESQIPQSEVAAQSAPAQEIENPVENVPLDEEREVLTDWQEPLSEDEPTAATQTDVPTEVSFLLPVSGEVFETFSNGELVKNTTLGDWRTHNGIDIAADEGTNVAAAADGTVRTIESDPLWGTVITIDHGDGLVSASKGLTKNVTVKAGDSVAKGQVIGEIGTAAAESMSPAHLHFEMTKDGSYVDPLETMGLA